MKKYNIQNYVRYKEDLKASIKLIKHKAWVDYTDDELKVIFLPLVENIGRKFATSQQASGVLDIVDIIQCGSIGLCKAVEKLDRETLALSEDQEKTLKSFLAKRIRGTIRRAIDINRADMRIPEHDDDDMIYQIPDTSEPYNTGLLNMYLKSLLKKHLDYKEYEVLRMSYGLDCDKHSAKEIAAKLDIVGASDKLDIVGASDYVRVSELKKQAVVKLIDNVDHSQVLDYL
jgi:RNA polymerase sigma factor (sigma-70 family)